MTAAVDEPMLHHRSPGLVACDRAGIGPASGRSGLHALYAVTASRVPINDPCGIRRMDDVIRIAVEDDGPRAKRVIWRMPLLPPTLLQTGIAAHRRKRGRDVSGRPVGQTETYAAAGVDFGIGRRHPACHGASGGEACYEHAPRVDVVFGDN